MEADYKSFINRQKSSYNQMNCRGRLQSYNKRQ